MRKIIYSLIFTFLQELAIAHRTKRQSTVIAKEIIELLSIDAEVKTIQSSLAFSIIYTANSLRRELAAYSQKPQQSSRQKILFSNCKDIIDRKS